MATIGLVDDHQLIRISLAASLAAFGHTIVLQASNGKDLEGIMTTTHPLPDIILLDINMPHKDGYATALWLKENYPAVRVIALSMHDDDLAIIRMMRNGAKGFLSKDASPEQLKMAIDDVMQKEYYHSDLITKQMMKGIASIHDTEDHLNQLLQITAREEEFLKLCCSDSTYKEIAAIMNVSTRTVDSYRESLFQKLQVKSRSGLVTFAFRHRLVMV